MPRTTSRERGCRSSAIDLVCRLDLPAGSLTGLSSHQASLACSAQALRSFSSSRFEIFSSRSEVLPLEINDPLMSTMVTSTKTVCRGRRHGGARRFSPVIAVFSMASTLRPAIRVQLYAPEHADSFLTSTMPHPKGSGFYEVPLCIYDFHGSVTTSASFCTDLSLHPEPGLS